MGTATSSSLTSHAQTVDHKYVRIARFYVEFELGRLPSHEEIEQCLLLSSPPQETPRDFDLNAEYRIHDEVLSACDVLVRESSSYKDFVQAKRFLLGQRTLHRHRFFRCVSSSTHRDDDGGLDIFIRLGNRRRDENPKDFFSCFQGATRDWERMSALLRDQGYISQILLSSSIIGKLFHAEAPLHVFDQLLQARPALVRGKDYYRFFLDGGGQSNLTSYRDDIYELLIKHGADQAGEEMLHHCIRDRSVAGVHTLLNLRVLQDDRTKLNLALKYHLFMAKTAITLQHLNSLVPIALALVQYGADPMNKQTNAGIGPTISATGVYYGRLASFHFDTVVATSAESAPAGPERISILLVGDAVKCALVLTTMCSPLNVPRLGRDSLLRTLNVDVMRSLLGMLLKVQVMDDELMTAVEG